MSALLDIAIKAIKAGSEVALRHYSGRVRARVKADGSPVTAADLGAERVIRELIAKQFPGHDFYGEEYGRTNKQSEYCWLIDPIDGTKNFVDRIPLWGTLIALMKGGELILGVSHVPLMNELLWAERGKGAYLNGRRVRVSQVSQLSRGMISYGSLPAFKERRKQTALLKLIGSCRRQRSFGDLWPYHLLASGRLDIVIEAAIKPVDVAPFAIIVAEAGGMTSDIFGRPFSLEVDSFLATNGKLHREVARLFTK